MRNVWRRHYQSNGRLKSLLEEAERQEQIHKDMTGETVHYTVTNAGHVVRADPPKPIPVWRRKQLVGNVLRHARAVEAAPLLREYLEREYGTSLLKDLPDRDLAAVHVEVRRWTSPIG